MIADAFLDQFSIGVHLALAYPAVPGSLPFETYIRGELMTHSVSTLLLYAHQIEKAQKAGKNLCENILENVVHQLGYATLEAADNGIA